VGCVALYLILRDERREGADTNRRLLDAEQRAVRAEGELGARDARNVLQGRPYGTPYREDLQAAYARVVVLERENARLIRSRDEIRRLASHDPPSGPRLLTEGQDGRLRSIPMSSLDGEDVA
jgi:hypothetical protein